MCILHASCSSDPVIDARVVTLHASRACAPPADAYVLLTGAGDFQPSTSSPAQSGFLANALHRSLDELPAGTRQLVADVSSPSQGDARWTGVALLRESGPVDVLLWPRAKGCALTASVAARQGGTLTAIDASRVLVAGGNANPVPPSVLVDLGTGEVRAASPDLLRPRTSATATASRGSTLVVVAGGVGLDGELLDTAEMLDLGAASFVGDPITLSVRRASHGALSLTSGEVLLVGGRGPNGPLGSLEAIDPVARRARTVGLATLAVPRVDPTVLRLASGEILVAGGTDASGAPVSTLEWLAEDGSHASRAPRDLVASRRRAFVALPQGGALAVVAPDDPSSTIQNAWVLGAEGSIDAAPRVAGALGDVRLFGGGAAPLLWTGDRFLRWDSWSATFSPLFEASGEAGPPVASPSCAPDPGLALWTDGDHVTGLRYDATGPYTSFASPLLRQDTAHVAPDRAAGPAGIHFDTDQGLVLPEGTSVFVTEATFDGVVLDVASVAGRAPRVVLRDQDTEYVVGGASCPISDTARSIHLERRGAALTVSTDGGTQACPLGVPVTARLAIGLRGVATAAHDGSVAKDLSLVRLP